MPEIRLRPKHQVTLPASIVKLANLREDDKLTVVYANGRIIITPALPLAKDDVMGYAGLFSGAWGDTTAQIEQTMHALRGEW